MRFHRRTFPRWLFAVPIAILLLIGGGALYARGRPAVVGVFPAPGAVAVSGLAPVRISFSRAMNRASVENSLILQPSQLGAFAWEGNTLTFTPADAWPGGVAVSVTLTTDARSALGVPLAVPHAWSFTVARTMLAYLWPADAPANLYMLDPVGGDIVPLTETGGVLDYAVGPQGLFIYFSAENGAGGSALWRLDMLTRESERLLDCGAELCAMPQPSPDGGWLAYENAARQEVWLLGLGSGPPVRLGMGTRPLWSPDGLLAYYDRAGQAFRVVDALGKRLASFSNQLGEPGTWAPGGGLFVAPDADASADASRLLAYSPANSAPVDLSGEGLIEDTSPAFSPDGQQLAFARRYLDPERWTPGRQLWVMQADGSNARLLTGDEFYSHASFAWHPEGQQIAFVRAHRTAPNASPEIWIVNLDGSNPLRLVVGGYAPQWIP